MARFTVALATTLFALAFSAQAAPNPAAFHMMNMKSANQDETANSSNFILSDAGVNVAPASFNCTIALVSITAGLKLTSDEVNALDDNGDETVASALSDTKSNITAAQDGINTLLGTILAKQPPADVRDQTRGALDGADKALQSISDVDGAAQAREHLIQAAKFGNDVVSNC